MAGASDGVKATVKTRISIVTPSYNQGSFLEATLKSVNSQRRFIHEYFVVDGGSDDSSASIIKKYERNIDWWVSERDQGQTDAIKKGFARATGDVLAWINSDDIYLPNALEAVQLEFDRNPQIDILTGYMIHIDAKSLVTKLCRIPAPNALLLKCGFVYVTQPSTFFRRSLYERVGGLDDFFHCAMDADLWCRFYRAKPVWKTIPRYLVGFRGHGENKGMSLKWKQRYEEEGLLVKERYPELMRSPWGLYLYRTRQALSGSQLISMMHTHMFRGRSVGNLPDSLFAR